MKDSWKLDKPLNAIVFDCDGTLSRLEGIDELAEENAVGKQVKSITADAMTHTGMTPEIYESRLELVKPTRQQVENLGERYFKDKVPDVENVIGVFQRLGKTVFVMSAGIKLSVDIFAQRFKIPASQVFAVDVSFDKQGHYCDFDRQSPLTSTGGKGSLIKDLKREYPEIMHVGDGANDIDVKDHVTRFVGYGGVFYRESILSHSHFYIQSLSMSPLLALALTKDEAARLAGDDLLLYEKGLSLIAASEVIVN